MEYRAFDLRLRSCLPLPLRSPGRVVDDPVDVDIVYGSVPTRLENALVRVPWLEAAPRRLLLTVDGVARYLVEDGRRIVIDRDPAATDEDIRAFLLGSAFCALMLQRHELVLHGSAVDIEGRGVAFLGAPASGKSTVAAALLGRGYRVLADDLCVIRMPDDGTADVVPGFARVKLRPDAIRCLGIPPQSLEPVRDDSDKRGLSIASALDDRPVPVRKIYVLAVTDREDMAITLLAGVQRVRAVSNHVFRSRFVEGLGLKGHNSRQVFGLAGRIPIALVTRPRRSGRVSELVDRIVADALGGT